MNLQALSLGLYVHIPFCSNACLYCAFYKERPTKDLVQHYLQELLAEINLWKERLQGRSIDTIFWGGGSPSSLSCRDLEVLGENMQPFLKNVKEWTIEVSPLSINREKLKLLKELGVTRLSMGVQSFQADILSHLGRRQKPEQVYRSYEAMRSVGFKNINLDLIFSQTSNFSLWQKDLQAAIQLNPEHLSTYCLSFEQEEGPFKQNQKVDSKRETELYLYTWEYLQSYGYEHYEVSNFARPGYACQHNLHTWQMHEWIGVGPSAASQWQQQRFQNAANSTYWLKQPKINCVSLSDEMLFVDCLTFGLRLYGGIHLKHLQRRFPNISLAPYQAIFKKFQEAGWATWTPDKLVCTPKGLLLADALAQEIFDAS